jgi:phospholipid/cholesterol/gamma-HCH transport system permease protein
MHAEVRDGGLLHVRLSGDWNIGSKIPDPGDLFESIKEGASISRLTFDSEGITNWDSGLLTFLTKVFEESVSRKMEIDEASLPQGVQRLLKLATAVPERKGARREAKKVPFLHRVADSAVSFKDASREMLDFLGESTIASFRFLRGKAQYRKSDFWLVIEEVGVKALPIVSLISLLVGLILAFVGAVQLMMFGAQIYVASLVGIAMVRVMGAIMAGIIMAGRTGAAFAAQLGTMQVNEEIDALKTMGISPMEFLVLPRMFALALMMPILCIYADLMGMLGGLIVGVTMLDLNFMEYYNKTVETVALNHFWVGLFHSFVFGILVALAGCLRGMQCGRSATAVGFATTSAVVTGIVAIILATAVITVLCNVLGV